MQIHANFIEFLWKFVVIDRLVDLNRLYFQRIYIVKSVALN